TDRVKINVAGQLAVGQAVHANVDDYGAGANHVGLEEVCLTDRDDDDISLASQFREVLTAAMADRDGCIGSRRLLHQDESERLTDDIAPPDNDDVGAVHGNIVANEQLLDAERRAGQETRMPGRQQTDIFWTETVH